MKMLFKKKLRRYIIAAILLVASAYGAIIIKAKIDSRNPELSLPEISVAIGYNPPYVVRAGYTWRFGFQTVYSPFVSAVDVPLMVTDARPEENISITFTMVDELVELFMTKGKDNDDFKKQYTWITPKEEGVYVYRVNAEFEKGKVQYYFAINVKQTNLQP
jgi:hypothetical protein